MGMLYLMNGRLGRLDENFEVLEPFVFVPLIFAHKPHRELLKYDVWLKV